MSTMLPMSGPQFGNTQLYITGTFPVYYQPSIHVGPTIINCNGSSPSYDGEAYDVLQCVTPNFTWTGDGPLSVTVDHPAYTRPPVYTPWGTNFYRVYPAFSVRSATPQYLFAHKPTQVVLYGGPFTATGEEACVAAPNVPTVVITHPFHALVRVVVDNTSPVVVPAYSVAARVDTRGFDCGVVARAVLADVVIYGPVNDTTLALSELPLWVDPATCGTNATRVQVRVGDLPAQATLVVLIMSRPSSTGVLVPVTVPGPVVFPFFDDFTVVDNSSWHMPTSRALAGVTDVAYSASTSNQTGLVVSGPWLSTAYQPDTAPAFELQAGVRYDSAVTVTMSLLPGSGECINPYLSLLPPIDGAPSAQGFVLTWNCSSVCLNGDGDCLDCPLSAGNRTEVTFIARRGGVSAVIERCGTLSVADTVVPVSRFGMGIASNDSASTGVVFHWVAVHPAPAEVVDTTTAPPANETVVLCSVPRFDLYMDVGDVPLGAQPVSFTQNGQQWVTVVGSASDVFVSALTLPLPVTVTVTTVGSAAFWVVGTGFLGITNGSSTVSFGNGRRLNTAVGMLTCLSKALVRRVWWGECC